MLWTKQYGDTMKNPFEDASTLHFEVDEIGEENIRVHTDKTVLDCDRIDMVMIDHVPMWILSTAVEDMFYPHVIMPLDTVKMVENPMP